MRIIYVILYSVLCSVVGAKEVSPIVLGVVLGERPTNVLVTTRISLPIVGPVLVPSLEPGAGMVSYFPDNAKVVDGEPVILNVAIDLHGVGQGGSVPPVLVRTKKGTFELRFDINAVPFSNEFPCRFAVLPGAQPVPFLLSRGAMKAPFTDLFISPANAPVDLKWSVSADGNTMYGTVGVLANPPLEASDGILHDAVINFITKDGETDFMRFQWLYPRPLLLPQTEKTMDGGTK